jgi:hypothetical protein
MKIGILSPQFCRRNSSNNLPYDEHRIEEVPKDDLEPCMVNASLGTRTKGPGSEVRRTFSNYVVIGLTFI